MTSAKVETKKDAKTRAREAAAVQIDVTVQQRLVASYDTYVENGKKALWKLVDDLTNDPAERNVVLAIDLLKAGLAKRNGLEWKGRKLDPEYVHFGVLCSKIKKVVLHPSYLEYRKSGKSLHTIYDEIMDPVNKRKHNIDVDKIQRRATKATNELHEKSARRKEIIEENRNKDVAGSSHVAEYDMYKEWIRDTNEILKDSEGRETYVKKNTIIARDRPKLFVRMLQNVVEAGYLPTGVLMEIEE